MSRPRGFGAKYEKELLAAQRSNKKASESYGYKMCASLNCDMMGKDQPIEVFRVSKMGRRDSYCYPCRQAFTSDYKFRKWSTDEEAKDNAIAKGLEPPRPKPRNQQKRYQAQLEKWQGIKKCDTHKIDVRQCGCGGHRHIKLKKWKVNMSVKLKGNRRSVGNKSRKGGHLTSEHKVRLSHAMQAYHRQKMTESR